MDNKTPLYNSRNIHLYMKYIEEYYPEIDTVEVLKYAKMTLHEIEDPGHWFNQNQVDKFYKKLVEKTGNIKLARDVGNYFSISQSGVLGAVKQYIIGMLSISTGFNAIEKIGLTLSRGAILKAKRIGAKKYKVTAKVREGVIEKPYQCMNRKAILEAIGLWFTDNFFTVDHPECYHEGGKDCKYIVSWKDSQTILWKRLSRISVVFSIFLLMFFIPLLSSYKLIILATACAVVSLLVISVSLKKQNRELSNSIVKQGESAQDLIDEINIRYSNSKLIQEIGHATSNLLNVSSISEIVIKLIEKNLDFDRGLILLTDSRDSKLICRASFGYDQTHKNIIENNKLLFENDKEIGELEKVFNSQIPVLKNNLHDTKDELSHSSFRLLTNLKSQSFICVPIVYENLSLGVLFVDNKKPKRPLVQSDVSLLIGVASQTALSITNARSYHKLEESEKKHRTLVETMRDIVYTVDLEGRFTYVSPMVEIITGYSTTNLIGHKFEDVIIPSQREAVRKNFEENLKAETVSSYQVQVASKKGKGIPLEINTTMLFDAQGKPIGRIGVARDITRRTEEEEKRKEMEIKALAQDKLASLGEIATGVAHEINQPLSYIKIILESTLNDLAKKQLNTEELSEDFQESLRQIGKITNIISHLRTFGRSDVTSQSPVSLPSVFKDTMILMKERMKVKNIIINQNIAENLPIIYGNSVKLEQVFVNLLQNSMDALEDQGKGEINLHIFQENDEVVVKFSDNGLGMQPEVLDRIFEPFYTTKDVGQGTGIGLSIVYGIIQEHHGTVKPSYPNH
jgi:PAS domain S-box-containing protein